MLSVVALPIGNLGDITVRAKGVLSACDAIVCEDTRVTGKLLNALGLEKKKYISMHSYSDPKKLDEVIAALKEGAHYCLVSDAGTPGISDPGYALTSRVRDEGLPMEAVPGPSAFLTALSISGLPINQFVYIGFPPLKKGRQTLFQSFIDEKRTIVLYESVHRIQKTLTEIADALSSQPDRTVAIGRELTKMHEEMIHTTIGGLADTAKNITTKGEFVIVVGAQR